MGQLGQLRSDAGGFLKGFVEPIFQRDNIGSRVLALLARGELGLLAARIKLLLLVERACRQALAGGLLPESLKTAIFFWLELRRHLQSRIRLFARRNISVGRGDFLRSLVAVG